MATLMKTTPKPGMSESHPYGKHKMVFYVLINVTDVKLPSSTFCLEEDEEGRRRKKRKRKKKANSKLRLSHALQSYMNNDSLILDI